MAIVEHPFPPGALVPPHVHTREDEFSIVTAGAIGFRSGADEVVLEAGGYISKPRGELHTMWNAGPDRGPHDRGHHAGRVRALLPSSSPTPSPPAPPTRRPRATCRPRTGSSSTSTWVPELMEKYGLITVRLIRGSRPPPGAGATGPSRCCPPTATRPDPAVIRCAQRARGRQPPVEGPPGGTWPCAIRPGLLISTFAGDGVRRHARSHGHHTRSRKGDR